MIQDEVEFVENFSFYNKNYHKFCLIIWSYFETIYYEISYR